MKAACRLAWREMTRHKIRSLIGILIVTLPIALVSMGVCTLWIQLRPLSDPAIQAVVSASAMTPVQQDYRGKWTLYPEEPQSSEIHNFSTLTTESLEEIVAPNKVLPVFETTAFTTADHSAHSITIAQFDGTAVPGYLGIVEGRAPSTGEIVLNGKKAHDMGVSIGDSFDISVQNFSAHVYVSGLSSSTQTSFVGVDTIDFNAATSTHQANKNSTDAYNNGTVEYSWIVTGNEPVTWDQIKQINKQGSTVVSTWGQKNPPAKGEFYPGVADSTLSYVLGIPMLLIYAVALILILLVLILMLTPVFTISAHSMRRSLAHVLMNGGEAKHIRAIVLIHGVFIGIAGGLLGSAGGFGILVCLNGSYILRVPWIVPITLIISLAGFVFGITAALIPALQAARLTPIAAVKTRAEAIHNLTMRFTLRKPSTFTFFALFIGGTLILVVSAIIMGNETFNGTSVPAAIGALIFPLAVLAEIVGAIGMVPSIIWIASTKLHLRGTAKIAVRDLLRSAHRTVPAVGALVGVLIGVTMILSFLSLTQRSEADLAFGGNGPVGSLKIRPERNRAVIEETTNTALKKATNDYIERFGSAKILDSFSFPGYRSTLYLYVPTQTVTDFSNRTCFTLSTNDLPAEGQGSNAPFSEGRCNDSSWIPLNVSVINDIEALISYAGWEGNEAQQARDTWQKAGIIDVSAIFQPSRTDPLPAIPSINTWSSTAESFEHIRALSQETLKTASLSNKNNTFFEDVIISAKTAQQWGITNNMVNERTLIFDNPLQPQNSWAVSHIAHRYDSVLQISANQRTFIDAYGIQITIAILFTGLFIFMLFIMAIASEEMRSDYATLYAVGASPRALSSLSALQGAAMGIIALIGIPAGLVPILAIWQGTLPWSSFVLMAVLTPCVTAIAAAFTRPRHLQLTQRYD